jgi:hypothetical protein
MCLALQICPSVQLLSLGPLLRYTPAFMEMALNANEARSSKKCLPSTELRPNHTFHKQTIEIVLLYDKHNK